MAKLDLTAAADLLRDLRDRRLPGDAIRDTIDIRGAQATMLKDGTLLIPGTNEIMDWFDFNLQIGPVPIDGHGFELVPGDSGTLYHGGFLEHAQLIYPFAKAHQPKFILGHSLGAASAQIIGMSLRVPTIAFASPKTTKARGQLPGEGWVVNLCRIDDTVCHMPPRELGFRNLGSVYWMAPDVLDVDEDHSIEKYHLLLKLKRIRERVPIAWPR